MVRGQETCAQQGFTVSDVRLAAEQPRHDSLGLQPEDASIRKPTNKKKVVSGYEIQKPPFGIATG